MIYKSVCATFRSRIYIKIVIDIVQKEKDENLLDSYTWK